jgi:dolichyl-phosphate-mannose--protein O-mannosyl transferase
MSNPLHSASGSHPEGRPINQPLSIKSLFSQNLALPYALAFAQLTLQILFHGDYGYFRDELYYIACSKHLALGYVDQPPLSLFILAVTRWVLGDSLQAIRFFPSLAGAVVVVIAALMTRKLGGGRFAQGLASFSVVAAHVLLGTGRYFSMNAFDVVFWSLALYLVVRIFVEDNPRLWLWFGVVIGLGLLNK